MQNCAIGQKEKSFAILVIKTLRSDLIYEGFFIFTFLCSLKTKYPAT